MGRHCAVSRRAQSSGRHRAPRYSHDNEARSTAAVVARHAWGRGGRGEDRAWNKFLREWTVKRGTRFRKSAETNAALVSALEYAGR